MKISVKCCDVCKSEGNFELATGFYTTPEKAKYDACDKHLEMADLFKWLVVTFANTGDYDEELFVE